MKTISKSVDHVLVLGKLLRMNCFRLFIDIKWSFLKLLLGIKVTFKDKFKFSILLELDFSRQGQASDSEILN